PRESGAALETGPVMLGISPRFGGRPFTLPGSYPAMAGDQPIGLAPPPPPGVGSSDVAAAANRRLAVAQARLHRNRRAEIGSSVGAPPQGPERRPGGHGDAANGAPLRRNADEVASSNSC